VQATRAKNAPNPAGASVENVTSLASSIECLGIWREINERPEFNILGVPHTHPPPFYTKFIRTHND